MNFFEFFERIKTDRSEVDKVLDALKRFRVEKWRNYRKDAPSNIRKAIEELENPPQGEKKAAEDAGLPEPLINSQQAAKFCRGAKVPANLLLTPTITPWEPAWTDAQTVGVILGCRRASHGNSVVATDDSRALASLVTDLQQKVPCRIEIHYFDENWQWSEVKDNVSKLVGKPEYVALVSIGSLVPNLATEVFINYLGVEVPIMRRRRSFGDRARDIFDDGNAVSFDLQPPDTGKEQLDAALYLGDRREAWRHQFDERRPNKRGIRKVEDPDEDREGDAGVIVFGDAKIGVDRVSNRKISNKSKKIRLVSLYGLGGEGTLLARRAASELSEELESLRIKDRALSVMAAEDIRGQAALIPGAQRQGPDSA